MRRILLIAAVVIAACAPPETEAELNAVVVHPVRPDVRDHSRPEPRGTFDQPSPYCAATIPYNGGSVMRSTAHVYLIWYGNWSGNTAKSILPDLIAGLSNSPRFKIDSTFTDGNGAATSTVQLSGQYNDAYSQGSVALSQAAIFNIVSHAISVGAFPNDPNGVYYVLTSSDVTQVNDATKGDAFCSTYCGWHSWQQRSFFLLKYVFVGNVDRCPDACISNHIDPVSPNGNRGADGMASVMVHELDETVTDPLINAWYAGPQSSVCENADNCAWSFGGLYPTPSGSHANAHLGTRDFLVQRDWVNYGSGYCSTSWAGVCDGTPGQWNGCRGTGCNVCAEQVANAPCYFRNHPNCNKNDTCAGQYFTCNANCPAPSGADFDCHRCGNGVCDPDENAGTCPSDCPAVCGDGICSPGENIGNCGDCQTSYCGDGFCDASNFEDCGSCPDDCGLCGPGGPPSRL